MICICAKCRKPLEKCTCRVLLNFDKVPDHAWDRIAKAVLEDMQRSGALKKEACLTAH